MRQASKRVPDSAEKTVRDIRRATRRSDEQIAAEQQKKKNEENAYKDAIKKIPDQPVKQSDPWANMR